MSGIAPGINPFPDGKPLSNPMKHTCGICRTSKDIIYYDRQDVGRARAFWCRRCDLPQPLTRPTARSR